MTIEHLQRDYGALVHDYFNVDTGIVWSVLQNDPTPLKAAVEDWLSNQE